MNARGISRQPPAGTRSCCRQVRLACHRAAGAHQQAGSVGRPAGRRGSLEAAAVAGNFLSLPPTNGQQPLPPHHHLHIAAQSGGRAVDTSWRSPGWLPPRNLKPSNTLQPQGRMRAGQGATCHFGAGQLDGWVSALAFQQQQRDVI